LAIKHTNTHLGLIKHSNILDFCYDLTRDYIIIRHTGKNLKATRIPDIRIRVLGYDYDYIAEIIIKILT